ncbi:fimbrillin family protein [Bacteroides fragilis]
MNRLSKLRNRMRVAAAAVCTACCVLALTACSDDTTADDSRLPDGEYPMTFTAAVDGLTVTRAGTADGKWTTTDQIAVQVSNAEPESGNGIKIYAPSDNGSSATLTSGDPFYWHSKNEKKTVSAWYCGDGSTASGGKNAGAVPTSWKVQPDQDNNEGEGYQQSDFLYAAPKSIQFSNPDKSLDFTHQTARVVINIKKAEAATEISSITKVTIGYDNNLALSGTYSVPTEGNATTGTWDISGGTMGTITPKDITASGSSDILKTYAALVIPQNMSNQKFIAVTLKDNNTYYYTPQSTDADLKSGTQYTYNITVKHGYLEVVTVKTDGVWGDGGEAKVESKEVAENFTADDLKIGDYYYSDGTTSDGGYRKYTDNTDDILDIKPVLTNPNTGDERTCIGIVYWVGDITGEDPLLKRDKPGCIHGLVVSLWDMPDPDNTSSVTMTWTYGDSEFVNDWLGSDVTWTERPDGFTSIQIDNKMQGYANTIALKEYNKYVEGKDGNGYGKDGNKRVKPVKGLDDFKGAHPSPSNSSGWYWPSVCELQYVCWGQGNEQGTNGRIMLNTQIGKVSGDVFDNYESYWSSTERSSSHAWCVYFNLGSMEYSGQKYYAPYRVRPLLAF